MRPRQNGRHFADDNFKRIFMNENIRISIHISLKFVPKGLINNIRALVQVMAWRRPGAKPLSGPMMVKSPMHICVTRPQWVNWDLLQIMSLPITHSVSSMLYQIGSPIICLALMIRASFLLLARSKPRLCLANHRAGYLSNLACDWLSIALAYSEQETENGPWWKSITNTGSNQEFNRLFRRRSKKISKLRVTCLCERNPPMIGGFLSQRTCNVENVSISLRHNVLTCNRCTKVAECPT